MIVEITNAELRSTISVMTAYRLPMEYVTDRRMSDTSASTSQKRMNENGVSIASIATTMITRSLTVFTRGDSSR